MKKMKFINEFKRIENIKNIPYDIYDMKNSYRILIEKFIKKSCKLRNYVGGDDRLFCFDEPVARHNRIIPEDVKEKIVNMLMFSEDKAEIGPGATRIILQIYLMWVYIAENNKDDLEAREFAEVYELLVILRERGGCIFREKGMFCCGTSEFRQSTMHYYFKNIDDIDISKESLDEYDNSEIDYFNKE